MQKVLLYYKYVQVPSPEAELLRHRHICEELGLKGRIIISSEGINGTCSGNPESIERYKQWMNEHAEFHGIHFKESESENGAFKKLSIRVRDELVTLRHTVDVSQAAEYITPEELHTALTDNEEIILVDMRNDYEADIGRFQNAVVLPIR